MSKWRKGHQLKQGKYIVDKCLGKGGFGITYRVIDTSTEEQVVVKTLNRDCQNRNDFPQWQERFVSEAIALASCHHEHIVRVSPLMFQEENVWCMVMEYVEGENLQSYLDTNGKLAETDAIALVERLGDALSCIHERNLLHRDVKPDNVLLRHGHLRSPVLIDFGSAREYESGQTQVMTSILTPGFAPIEQYKGKGNFGPWTDVYALAATLYISLTEKSPLPAETRKFMPEAFFPPQYFNPEISDRTNAAILAGMAFEPGDRPPSIAQWLSLLVGERSPSETLKFTASNSTRIAREPTAAVPATQKIAPNASIQSERASELKTDRLALLAPTQIRGEESSLTRSSLPLASFSFAVAIANARGEPSSPESHQAHYVREDLGRGGVLDLIAIPGGEFLMGSPQQEAGRDDDESPQHRVQIRDFYLGKYPVTQAQWQAVAALPKIDRDLDPNPAQFSGSDRPVEQISWYEALEFCARLSHYSDRAYRLPSEAEWEYACRAGSSTPFACGETATSDLANYDGRYIYASEPAGIYREQTTPVGSFAPNRWGLYDLHGNVWEWTCDRYCETYRGAPNNGSARLENADGSITLRGGSWRTYPWGCRSANRVKSYPGDRSNDIGFRVVAQGEN